MFKFFFSASFLFSFIQKFKNMQQKSNKPLPIPCCQSLLPYMRAHNTLHTSSASTTLPALDTHRMVCSHASPYLNATRFQEYQVLISTASTVDSMLISTTTRACARIRISIGLQQPFTAQIPAQFRCQ